MSRITVAIGSQAFELIRDRLVEILVDEFEGQYLLTYDSELEVNVFKERNNPLDKTELSSIVVSLATGSYSNKNQLSVDGEYSYNIDIYTNEKTNDAESGDTRSALKLQKIIGITRAILEDQAYKTLGFVTPKIMHTMVTDINIRGYDPNDTMNTSMGRLSFKVRAIETTLPITPSLIAGYQTGVLIDLSGKGYFYQS